MIGPNSAAAAAAPITPQLTLEACSEVVYQFVRIDEIQTKRCFVKSGWALEHVPEEKRGGLYRSRCTYKEGPRDSAL
jgi:hypothetical protein